MVAADIFNIYVIMDSWLLYSDKERIKIKPFYRLIINLS